MKLLAPGLALAALSAFASPAALAGTILNQLPTNTEVAAENAFTSQIFGAPYDAYDVAVVDSFTISSATDITSISAALQGFNGFSSFSNITGYSVEIYSSAAAAAQSLTGNVASVNLAPGGVSLTFPYSTADAGLVNVPLNILLAAGTYDFAVIATLALAHGQIGVISNDAAGTSFQANPGGGFGYPGNIISDGVEAGYEVTGNPVGVPEPASLAALTAGLAALGLTRRRRA